MGRGNKEGTGKIQKIRILVPIRYPVGGIRTFLKYTYPNMSKNNYELTIVSPDKKYLDQLQKDLSQIDVNVIHTEKQDSFNSFIKQIWKLLRKEKFDLVHSQGFTAGIAAVFAIFFNKVPHLMTSHDILRHEQFKSKFSWLKKKLLEIFFDRIQIIQSVSYDAQNNLLNFLPALKKKTKELIVIHNGIDLNLFAEDLNSEEIIMKNKAEFIIGFIGRYMPQKGFVYLMDIVEILKRKLSGRNFKIVSVGSFGAFIREYKKELKKREIIEYFEFIGFQENINKIIREINILVMPSLWEACPILPMEALVCGTPIIAFSCIGLREVLNNTPAILTEVKNSEEMAKKIINIMLNYQRVRRKFTDFIPEAKRRFDVKHCAERLEKELLKLLN